MVAILSYPVTPPAISGTLPASQIIDRLLACPGVSLPSLAAHWDFQDLAVHPPPLRKLTFWTQKYPNVWKMIFLYKQVIFLWFHVNFPGCRLLGLTGYEWLSQKVLKINMSHLIWDFDKKIWGVAVSFFKPYRVNPCNYPMKTISHNCACAMTCNDTYRTVPKNMVCQYVFLR